jgi:hypothetical protein
VGVCSYTPRPHHFCSSACEGSTCRLRLHCRFRVDSDPINLGYVCIRRLVSLPRANPRAVREIRLATPSERLRPEPHARRRRPGRVSARGEKESVQRRGRGGCRRPVRNLAGAPSRTSPREAAGAVAKACCSCRGSKQRLNHCTRGGGWTRTHIPIISSTSTLTSAPVGRVHPNVSCTASRSLLPRRNSFMITYPRHCLGSHSRPCPCPRYRNFRFSRCPRRFAPHYRRRRRLHPFQLPHATPRPRP